MRHIYSLLIIIFSLLVFIFIFQNLMTVSIHFLTFNITMPLSILALIIYFVGMASGGVLVSSLRTVVQRATTRKKPHVN